MIVLNNAKYTETREKINDKIYLQKSVEKAKCDKNVEILD